uniref:Uncharacterized protein n=1 Tax=Timema shepardi TaxID=629360 RepID=A0A7R9B340_TIMSH|nr:unnamed protein product [Timema shepardi]
MDVGDPTNGGWIVLREKEPMSASARSPIELELKHQYLVSSMMNAYNTHKMASSTITSDVTDEIERNTLKMDEPESSHQAKESEEICSAPCNLFVNATCKGETGGSPDNKEAGLESSELVDDGSICSNIANSENVSQFFQDTNAPDQVETSSLNNGKVEPPKQSQAPSVGVGKVLDQLNVSGLGQLCVYVSEDSDDSEDCETDISSAAVVHITHPASLEEGVSAFIKRQSDSSLESSDSSSSDWEFHSDTGSASSEEEEEEEDDHGAQDAQGQAQMLEVDKGAKKVGPLRTNGEITLDDLPPIEDLHISVPEEDCKELGKVCSIVDKLGWLPILGRIIRVTDEVIDYRKWIKVEFPCLDCEDVNDHHRQCSYAAVVTRGRNDEDSLSSSSRSSETSTLDSTTASGSSNCSDTDSESSRGSNSCQVIPLHPPAGVVPNTYQPMAQRGPITQRGYVKTRKIPGNAQVDTQEKQTLQKQISTTPTQKTLHLVVKRCNRFRV